MKKLFLADNGVNLDGKEHCESFFETHVTTPEIAKTFYSYIELTYDEDGILDEAICRDEDTNVEELIIRDEIPFKNYRLNKIINFHKDLNGINYIGGTPPSDFEIPENQCPGSFQYLGLINQMSVGFEWLPFNVNLICPIFTDMNKIWIDYSIATKPEILNKEMVNNLTSAFSEVKPDSFIEYEKITFSTKESGKVEFDLGHSGIPEWVQFSDIPRCPKTNKTMRFLCQLLSDKTVKTSRTNIVPSSKYHNQYFETLDFWCGGDLFVFFEPESKIACYLIQNT